MSELSSAQPLSERALTSMQNVIVDERYRARGYRTDHVWIGAPTSLDGREFVDYIAPPPGSLFELMDAWCEITRRLIRVDEPAVDPTIAATIASFLFVYIHPFDDGNGRLHRWVVQWVLAQRGFGIPGVIVPVSSTILNDRRGYELVLESFSRRVMSDPLISYSFDDNAKMHVSGDHTELYRYPDLTAHVEAMFGWMKKSIDEDLNGELSWLKQFDRIRESIRHVVEMPDRKELLFITLCMQNDGRLSRRKRDQFAEITDEELTRLEEAVRAAREP